MKNPALLIFCLIHFTSISLAQYNPDKINKKAVEVYKKGMQQIEEDNYKGAMESLQEAIRRDANYVEAYLSLAGIYGNFKDYRQSISIYEKAFAMDSNYSSELRLPYAINLAHLGQFDKALNAINTLLSKTNLNPNTKKAAEYRQKSFQFAVDFSQSEKAKNYRFEPKNLGDGVNSKESEYFPSLPIDGKELIFTRRLSGFNEDFFLSNNAGDQNWQLAYRLNGNINTPENEGAQMISQDGQWLVFTGCNRAKGFGSCDLYLSYLTPEGWSEAINLGNKINTEDWESQPSLSPDKKDLYFASRRPGGFGGSDLYVSHLGANGRWTEPENLGPGINTAGDEQSPFIHADNQTLYFASNGLPGYGDADLFVTRKENGKWGQPENLGYPINTLDREGTLFIAADGKTAYYASDRSDSKGGLDIYSFELREDIRPHKTLWVKGKVFDKNTNAGLPSAVELIELTTKQPISRVQTDEKGTYLLTLPVGKDYAFNVNRKGYLFYSDNFSLTNKSPDSTYEKNIPLQPIELNASVVLRNIFFDLNKYELKTQSTVELDKVVQLLRDNPAVRIQISGHTDNIGTATDNLKLSDNRAKSVINYLVSKGVDPKRLTSKGFGATQPVADNKTEEGRALNRRTELKVIGR